ncbi:U1 small nuclear ribonucleoprotein 70 kDa [Smittium culicis]|uniref:U1 small nuclear ribonucleoprotein 70 kDa n=1 Tax=Smittium culicis TaxID=133412 RepID=A0A1R1Y4S4_9FUNG|nr:U1 small nuclear ribonucleoprotein 70 kDa [Smittium culicis]
MTSKLPPDLLNLFSPRPPLPYAKPLDKDLDKRKGAQISGISSYIELLKTEPNPNYSPSETPIQKKDRLNYQVSERDLKREFERYGPILSVKLIKDKAGNSRGYAFLEYENERDLRVAYRESDGARIMGKRVVVDVERGRTVKGWLPRRLGGGLGGTRIGGVNENHTYSGRYDPAVNEKNSPAPSSYPPSRVSSRKRDYNGPDSNRDYKRERGGSRGDSISRPSNGSRSNGYDSKYSRDYSNRDSENSYRADKSYDRAGDKSRSDVRDRDRDRNRPRDRERDDREKERKSYRNRSRSPKRQSRR